MLFDNCGIENRREDLVVLLLVTVAYCMILSYSVTLSVCYNHREYYDTILSIQ